MASLAAWNSAPSPPVSSLPPDEVVFGRSLAMGALRKALGKAANADVPVLLQGQSGTGKEILARLIHCRSPWESGPFLKVNCPAIPMALLESEFFACENGAITGAWRTKPGQAEPACRGTLFLDEVAELDAALQTRLLHSLQDGEFCRIAAPKGKQVEARVVSATTRRLQQEIESGSFRPDLFYRINVLTIQVPSLRDRTEDIPILVSYFLETYGKTYNCPARPLSRGLLENLQKYHWPGNIRELENLMKRYAILGSEDEIQNALGNLRHDYLNSEIPSDSALPLKQAVRQAAKQLERKMIFRALEANRWNRRLAARTLRISYTALLYKMREAGVPVRSPGGQREATIDSGDRMSPKP